MATSKSSGGVKRTLKTSGSKLLGGLKKAIKSVSSGGTKKASASTSKKPTVSSLSSSRKSSSGGSSYRPTSITSLTSGIKPSQQKTSNYSQTASAINAFNTSNRNITMPEVAPGPQSKPIVFPKVTPGPQTKKPQVKFPKVKKGPQSIIPGTPGGMSYIPPKPKASSGGGTTFKSTTDEYRATSLQALESVMDETSGDEDDSSGGPSARSSSAGGSSGSGSSTASTSSFAPGSSGGSTDSSSPSSQLDAARKQLEEMSAQAEKLMQDEATSVQDAVVSDSEMVKQEKETLNELNDLTKVDNSSLDILNEEIARNEKLLLDETDALQKSFDSQKTDLEVQQRGEAGQTSAAIAAAGGYLGFSGSGTAVMLKLAESHRAEVTSLEAERQNAIVEARKLAAERRFDMVGLKVDEIARIDQEIFERTQDYYSKVKEKAEVERVKAERQQTENSIFTAIKAGAKSAEDIFELLDGKVSVEEISKYLKTMVPDSVREIGAGFKFSASNTMSLLGAGMNQDDILALNEYVNENGYTEEVRSQLTAMQRAAADKIFRPVSGSSTSGFGKPMTVLDLDRIEESYGVRFPFGTTQAEATQFFADNPGATEQELQDALDQVLGKTTSGNRINFTTDYLKNLDFSKQKNLADLVGASSWWFSDDIEDVNTMFSNQSFIDILNEKIDDMRINGVDGQPVTDQEIIDSLTTKTE